MTTRDAASAPTTAAGAQLRLNAISLVLVLGAVTTLLDTTIVNIALDRLRSDFDATVADTQWVSTAIFVLSAVPLLFICASPFDRHIPSMSEAVSTWP